jgi:CARDB
MSIPDTRLRVPALLLIGLTALLVFATAADAQTWTGETTTVVPIHLPPTTPEATLVKASASYESKSGSESFTVTTAAAPAVEKEGKPSMTLMEAEVVSDPAGCNDPALLFNEHIVPSAKLAGYYGFPTFAQGEFVESFGGLPVGVPTVKTVAGATTTLSTTAPEIANQSFNCAVVSVLELEAGTGSFMIFPLRALPEPPAPVVSTPAPAPPTPAPAAASTTSPPVLSITRPKPQKLKVDRSKTIQFKVSNTGATATAPGTLRVKAVKGVLVKPETQKLPVLAPGASLSVSVRVEVTATAKEKSTLSLTATASGLTAKSSLVIKRTE